MRKPSTRQIRTLGGFKSAILRGYDTSLARVDATLEVTNNIIIRECPATGYHHAMKIVKKALEKSVCKPNSYPDTA